MIATRELHCEMKNTIFSNSEDGHLYIYIYIYIYTSLFFFSNDRTKKAFSNAARENGCDALDLIVSTRHSVVISLIQFGGLGNTLLV